MSKHTEGVPTEDIKALVKRGKSAPELLEAMSAERFNRIVGEMGRMLRFVGDGKFGEREVREFQRRVLDCPYSRAIAEIEARRTAVSIHGNR